MHQIPLPAIAAALAALLTLPFSVVAASMLAFTAALGCIIHADYSRPHCRIRLPQRAPALNERGARPRTRPNREQRPLAA